MLLCLCEDFEELKAMILEPAVRLKLKTVVRKSKVAYNAYIKPVIL